MDGFDRLKQVHQDKQAKSDDEQREIEKQVANIQLQETVVKSFSYLVDYLDKKVTKTVVTNQLRSIGTPDALKVEQAVESLHTTLKTHKNTDLDPMTKLMREVLSEAKKIPKELPKSEKQQFVDYSKQLESLGQAVLAVQKVVKEQKLVVEPTDLKTVEMGLKNVHDAVKGKQVDLKPLQTSIKEVVKAVNGVVIPKYKTDNKEVEKLLKKSHKLLKEIIDKPVGGGGGGGGTSWIAVNTAGTPIPIQLDADGKLPVSGAFGGAGGATSAVTQVGDATTSTTLKALNANRIRLTITNDSSAVLYVKEGATASATSYTYRLAQYDAVIIDDYTGVVNGIWASDAGGFAYVTEITP